MSAEFDWDMDKDLISKLGNHLDTFLAYLQYGSCQVREDPKCTCDFLKSFINIKLIYALYKIYP